MFWRFQVPDCGNILILAICSVVEDAIYRKMQVPFLDKVVEMRSSFEIIAEILETAKNGAKKTRIMYTCGLSYRFVHKYLTLLLEAGLLKIGNSYHTTDKGMGFLRRYQTLELLMNTRN